MIWRENDSGKEKKNLPNATLKVFYHLLNQNLIRMVVCSLNCFQSVSKIKVQLEIVIQPCALLAADGDFEMGLSSAKSISYLIVAFCFCIDNSYLKKNNGFIMAILVVQMNY